MKRTVKIILTTLLIVFIGGGVAASQEKKETKQLKVIVENKDGTKVIIDTVFNSIAISDTITTGDGNVIFMTTKDGKDGNDLIAWAKAEKGSKGNVVYISKNGSEYISEGGKSYNIFVKTDDTGNSADNSNYVIAKDGMVITIEGDDDAKVQEIGKLIESQLGTYNDSGTAKTDKKTEKDRKEKK